MKVLNNKALAERKIRLGITRTGFYVSKPLQRWLEVGSFDIVDREDGFYIVPSTGDQAIQITGSHFAAAPGRARFLLEAFRQPDAAYVSFLIDSKTGKIG
jgi:hypothetical protein